MTTASVTLRLATQSVYISAYLAERIRVYADTRHCSAYPRGL